MNDVQIRELTSPFDGAQLECDGLTRVLHTVLVKNHVAHTTMAGRAEWKGKHIPLHFWIELPDGKVVDYRLRMWLGGSAPHGVFDPAKVGVTYEGRPVNMPVLQDFLFEVLAGRPIEAGTKVLASRGSENIISSFRNDFSVDVLDMPLTERELSRIRAAGYLSFSMRRGPYFHSPDMFVEPRRDKSGLYLMTPSGVRQAQIHAHYVTKEMFELSREDQEFKDYPDPGISGRKWEAGIKEVVDKIVQRVRDSELARRLTEKVMRYVQTRNPADDLTPQEVSTIYRRDEYGDDFDLPGDVELDVGWTNHAEYRTDLRGIDPSKVNEVVRDFAETHPGRHQKVNLMNRGIGKAVVDLNTTIEPEHAAVVTVMASENWQQYLAFVPSDGGEYYTLSIPVGVEPPAEGSRFVLNGVAVVSLAPKSPEDIAAGRGGPVANSMRANGIAYRVNCLPEGHEWLKPRVASGNDTKKQIIERVAQSKSAKVRKYVHDGLLRKIDQAGDAAPAWLEKLAGDFKKLKPEGLMEGFKDADFDDLWYVITGAKRKAASVGGTQMNESRIAAKIVDDIANPTQWGFDSTELRGAAGFMKVLSAVGISSTITQEPKRGTHGSFIWSAPGITIVTGNNPITGEYMQPDRRAPEVGYASYIGIEGKPNLVAEAVAAIRRNAVYIKGQSKGTRDFI